MEDWEKIFKNKIDIILGRKDAAHDIFHVERVVKNAKFLQSKHFDEIFHCIEAHSFSANIKPETIEAQIVQDADRLDALGAIGLYRMFSVATQLERNLADSLLHIEEKLIKIAATMQTESGREEARIRLNFIMSYLVQLEQENVSLPL